jgi:8-oxo-dGTP diphosphatase
MTIQGIPASVVGISSHPSLYFFSMTRVAVAILRRNGKLMVCQRRKGGRYALKWEFPGGKIEPGETILGCLERELYEELSIHITAVGRVESAISHYDDGGLFEVAYCHVSSFEGELQNNVFQEIRWVSPNELASMDVLEGNAEIIARLARP